MGSSASALSSSAFQIERTQGLLRLEHEVTQFGLRLVELLANHVVVLPEPRR